MGTEAITTALSSLITDVTAMATEAAPLVLGVVATLTGINVGISLFKRFAGKVA